MENIITRRVVSLFMLLLLCSFMMASALRQGSSLALTRLTLSRGPLHRRQFIRYASSTTVLGHVVKQEPNGMAILESTNDAQMTAGPGLIIDFEKGRKGFVIWARPPMYFMQILPGADGKVRTANCLSNLLRPTAHHASPPSDPVPRGSMRGTPWLTR